VFKPATPSSTCWPASTAPDFGKEIIPLALERGDNLQSYLFDDYWKTLGTIGAFYEANAGASPITQAGFSF